MNKKYALTIWKFKDKDGTTYMIIKQKPISICTKCNKRKK